MIHTFENLNIILKANQNIVPVQGISPASLAFKLLTQLFFERSKLSASALRV